MDPYIERPDIWPDFHHSVITSIRGILQPLLRPRYVSLSCPREYRLEFSREEIREPICCDMKASLRFDALRKNWPWSRALLKQAGFSG